MQKSDGYTGPIWVGAIKDEFGKWYDPTWSSLTAEEQAQKIAAAKT
jgi:hypothetical protein